MLKFAVLIAIIFSFCIIDEYLLLPYKIACLNDSIKSTLDTIKNPNPNVTIIYEVHDDKSMKFLKEEVLRINKNNRRANITLIAYANLNNERYSKKTEYKNCLRGIYKLSYIRIQNCIANTSIETDEKIKVITCTWKNAKSSNFTVDYYKTMNCFETFTYEKFKRCLKSCTKNLQQQFFDGISKQYKMDRFPFLEVNGELLDRMTTEKAVGSFSRFLQLDYGSYECRFYGQSYLVFISAYLHFVACLLIIAFLLVEVQCCCKYVFACFQKQETNNAIIFERY